MGIGCGTHTYFRILYFPWLAKPYLEGKLKLDELITRRLKLADINAGFDAMKRGELVRAVVEMPG